MRGDRSRNGSKTTVSPETHQRVSGGSQLKHTAQPANRSMESKSYIPRISTNGCFQVLCGSFLSVRTFHAGEKLPVTQDVMEKSNRGYFSLFTGREAAGVLRVGELHPAGKLLKTGSKQIKIALGSL